jgi:hypothetical protein
MKTKLGKAVVVSVAFALAAQVGGQVEASVIYKLTFDNDGPVGGNADDPYTLAVGDVSPETIDRLESGATIPQIAASSGPQGGKVLSLSLPASGDAGYLAQNTSGTFTVGAGGGVTWEAVSFASSWNPAASNIGGLISQGIGLQPYLRWQNGSVGNPQIGYGIGVHAGGGGVYTPSIALTGAWHHVGLVYTKDAGGGNSQLELFLDGYSVQTTVYATSAFQTFDKGGYSFGVDVPTLAELRVFRGQLDAVALSDGILGPETFVLPFPTPEPSVALLLGVGALLVWRRRNGA